MATPLISDRSTWQTKYNSDRGQLSDDNKTAADKATDEAFQAVNAKTPAERDAALGNAKDAIQYIKDSGAPNNGAVQDLTALTAVAQFQHDAKASKPDTGVLKKDADAAVDALEPIDQGAATDFAKSAYDQLNKQGGVGFTAREFVADHRTEFPTSPH